MFSRSLSILCVSSNFCNIAKNISGFHCVVCVRDLFRPKYCHLCAPFVGVRWVKLFMDALPWLGCASFLEYNFGLGSLPSYEGVGTLVHLQVCGCVPGCPSLCVLGMGLPSFLIWGNKASLFRYHFVRSGSYEQ